MANERGRNKIKREKKKFERLRRLVGVDLCACGDGYKSKCKGICREAHRNPKSGEVECIACYQIDPLTINPGGTKRQKRTWRYGRQKEENENQRAKNRRRERWQRNQPND
jgi:hypothetical protein